MLKLILLIGNSEACHNFIRTCLESNEGYFTDKNSAKFKRGSVTFRIEGFPDFEYASVFVENDIIISTHIRNKCDAIIYLDKNSDLIMAIEAIRAIRNTERPDCACVAINFSATGASPIECLEKIEYLQNNFKNENEKIKSVLMAANSDKDSVFANYPKDITTLICSTFFNVNRNVFFSLPKDEKLTDNFETLQLN